MGYMTHLLLVDQSRSNWSVSFSVYWHNYNSVRGIETSETIWNSFKITKGFKRFFFLEMYKNSKSAVLSMVWLSWSVRVSLIKKYERDIKVIEL